MLKIVYVTESLSVHDYRYLKEANNSDIKVFLFAIKENVPENIRALPNIEIYHNDLIVKYVRCHNRLMRCVYFCALLNEFKRWIKKIKPDVLHAGWVYGSSYFTALSGFHPFLLMPWGSDILIFPKISFRIRQMVRYAVKKADMIYCDCMDVKNDIVNSYGYPSENIVVFPFGIELSIFNPNHKEEAKNIRQALGWEDNKILIMNRNFNLEYNIECFLAALPAVIEELPETRVFLMGRGPLEGKFRKIVKENGTADKIHFTGFVSQRELPNYLCASDIYVSTSLTDGTSLSLLEAMACGLPVVVTNVPTNLEWIEDGVNGSIAPLASFEMLAKNIEFSVSDETCDMTPKSIGDSKLLAKKIIDLLKADKTRKIMGEHNLSIAKERADWDKNFGKFISIYNKLVKQKGSRCVG